MDWWAILPYLLLLAIAGGLGVVAAFIFVSAVVLATREEGRSSSMYEMHQVHHDLIETNEKLNVRLEKLTRKYERDLSRYRRIIYEERKRNGRLGAKSAGSAGSGSPEVRRQDEHETPD